MARFIRHYYGDEVKRDEMVGAYESIRKKTNAYKILVLIHGNKILFGICRNRRKDKITVLLGRKCEEKWICVVHGSVLWRDVVATGMNLRLFGPAGGLLITHGLCSMNSVLLTETQ